MPGRRSSRRELRPEMMPPGASHTTVCTSLLTGLLLCLQGMVVLYGGTRFWASAPFLTVALFLSGVLCLLQVWWAREEPGRLYLSMEFWTLTGCALYAALRGLLGSAVPYESWTEAYLLLCAALLWLSFVRLGSTKHGWMIVALTMLLAGVLHSMWAVQQHVMGDRSVLWLERPEHYLMRASGTFICPNHFGFLLQMGVVVALGILCMPRVRMSIRVFAGYALIVMFIALVLTLSRAALMGALAGMGIVLLFSPLRNRIRTLLLTGVGAVVVLVVATMSLLTFYEPAKQRLADFGTNNIRWSQIWPDTMRMIHGEGFWGSGPGTYVHVFDTYREKFNASWMYLEYAHNEYLHTIAEYGWIPSVLIAGISLWVCLRLARTAWALGPTRRGMIPAIMLGLWVGSLVQAVFDFHLHIPAVALVWVMLEATFQGAAGVRGCWKRSPSTPLQTRWVLGIAGFLSLLLVWPSVHLSMGSYHQYRSRLARESNDREQAAFHSAQSRDWLPGWYRGWRSLGLEKRTAAFWMREPVTRAALIAESRLAYETALELNPYDRISRAGLVELLKMEKRWEEALEELERLKEKAPFDAQVRIQEGLVLKRMGRTREALTVFQEAARLKKEPDRQIELNIRSLRERLKKESSIWIPRPGGLTEPVEVSYRRHSTGVVAEWSNARDCKSCFRRFESDPRLQFSSGETDECTGRFEIHRQS